MLLLSGYFSVFVLFSEIMFLLCCCCCCHSCCLADNGHASSCFAHYTGGTTQRLFIRHTSCIASHHSTTGSPTGTATGTATSSWHQNRGPSSSSVHDHGCCFQHSCITLSCDMIITTKTFLSLNFLMTSECMQTSLRQQTFRGEGDAGTL